MGRIHEGLGLWARTKKNTLVVYTAITGGYDTLHEPLYIDKDCDYICFTDQRITAQKDTVWKIINVKKDESTGSIKAARRIKALPHKYLPKQYTESLWLDACYEITESVRGYIKGFKQNDQILCVTHPERDCIYDEAAVCAEWKLDDAYIIERQMDRYIAQGYPKHQGLIASGILYREHRAPKVIAAMNEWWKEIQGNSGRDQLSFNYVCWKLGVTYDVCNMNCFTNSYFRWTPHKTAEAFVDL